MAKIKLAETTVDELYMQEDYAGEIEGVSFVATHETGDFDNHGGQILLLVVKDSSGQLYGGEFALNLSEGEIYEYPREFVPVERSERTVVVVDYLPIGQTRS